ncbi:MAG: FAD-dependent oxidoreductase [Parabacteroides sp.]|nr:FAD-dependent oxidoreductase [Parabacteroides sp.]
MEKYDVIIIGGGIGGLTCGAMLSKEGLRVCVLEQHSVIGGCLQSFRRNGCVFDTGIHYVGSLSEGQIMHQYFKYLGIVDQLRLQKLDENGFDHFHFDDGTSYCHAMGYERFVDTLVKDFPKERMGLEAFCQRIQYAGGLIAPSVLKTGKISEGALGYLSVPVYKEIECFIKNPKLRNILAGNCGLYAGSKVNTSLYEYGMITHSNIEGAYTFVEGSQQIADLLVEKIKSQGGEVKLQSKVTQIILNGGIAESVELDSGERLGAQWIISSLHPSLTFSLLANNTLYKKAFFTRINSLENTYGFFTTYLQLKKNSVKYVNQNHYFFNHQDVWSMVGNYKGYNIPYTFLSMQPNQGSEYTEVISLLTPMPFSACEKWADTTVGHRGEDYQAFKTEFSEAVIDFVCQYYPDLRRSIERIYTASPLTYRDYTATPDGSAYGLVKDCRNPMLTFMFARTKVTNLLLTGQNLNIHGCLGTTVSSAVTCSEILGMDYLSKKIGNA